jgi:ABC-type sugar transport system ATPase subunit
MSFLKLSKVKLEFSDFQLKDITFQINKGEKISILGLSGSGKSSLLSVVYGLKDIDSGEVVLGQEKVLGPSIVLIPGDKRIRLVDQNYALDNFHNVQENISNKILHFLKKDIPKRTSEILEVINMTKYSKQVASTLSGGQKQRLSLGRALAELPELLLLDEPFSQIDLMNKYEIERKLGVFLNENDISTIMVTHDYQDAFALSDRILIMKDGALLRDTEKKELYENPQSHYEAMISGNYNSIIVDGHRINFRRNEFALNRNDQFAIKLKLNITERIYLGGKTVISAKTNTGEKVVIETSFNQENFDVIYLKKKRYSFED